eukprot:s658_g24.t1
MRASPPRAALMKRGKHGRRATDSFRANCYRRWGLPLHASSIPHFQERQAALELRKQFLDLMEDLQTFLSSCSALCNEYNRQMPGEVEGQLEKLSRNFEILQGLLPSILMTPGTHEVHEARHPCREELVPEAAEVRSQTSSLGVCEALLMDTWTSDEDSQ